MECALRNNYYFKEVIIKFSMHPPEFLIQDHLAWAPSFAFLASSHMIIVNASGVRTIFGEALCGSGTVVLNLPNAMTF